jgi:hypothetical protein
MELSYVYIFPRNQAFTSVYCWLKIRFLLFEGYHGINVFLFMATANWAWTESHFGGEQSCQYTCTNLEALYVINHLSFCFFVLQ